MKSTFLILALALTTNVYAVEQEWVSVGAAVRAAPASSNSPIDSSQRATISSNLPPTAAGQGANTLVAELSLQVEKLQQEVSMLRGQVEQQEYQLSQLKEEGQQRYLDLDRRLAALVTTAPVVVKPSESSVATPDEAYQAAMALIRKKQFPEANVALDSFVKTYPKDPLVANALYWSGEVWMVRSDLDKAQEFFKRVIAEHPAHEKAADATYKIGVALHRQGKVDDAKKWLKIVIDKYTGKADATVNLAKSYLKRLQ